MAEAGRLLTLDVKDFTVDVIKTTGINIQSPSEFVQQFRQVIGPELAE